MIYLAGSSNHYTSPSPVGLQSSGINPELLSTDGRALYGPAPWSVWQPSLRPVSNEQARFTDARAPEIRAPQPLAMALCCTPAFATLLYSNTLLRSPYLPRPPWSRRLDSDVFPNDLPCSSSSSVCP